MTCPGCDAHLSSIYQAFERGEPCPNCGLPFDVAEQVVAVRNRVADEKLKADLEAALKRAGKAEAELRIARYRLEQVEHVLSYDLPNALKAEPGAWVEQ